MTEGASHMRWIFAVAVLTFAFAAPETGQAASRRGLVCDQACLVRTMDGYLAAVTAQNLKALAVSPGLHSRENTVRTPLDGGVWRGLTRMRAGQTFADPVSGNVVFAGVFDSRQGGLTPLVVRLKVEGGRIAESEVAYNTTPGRYFHPEELLQPDILYTAEVPPARRSTREELIGIGHAYMAGIAAHSGANVPMSYRCDKYYLGGKVTNTGPGSVGSCLESFNGIRALPPADRRTPVVDVARGIVVVSFLMPNAHKEKPDSTYEIEIIKVVDGKIRSVEEFGNVAAYPPSSGFGGDSTPNDKRTER